METSNPSVTMEGITEDVWDKLEDRRMAGYAYIFKPQRTGKDVIMPVKIPRPPVLKRKEPESAVAGSSAGGSVVK